MGKRCLLIKKNRPDWQKGYYNGVGGKVEPKDKDTHHTMIREFKEETNIYLSHWEPFLTFEYEDMSIVHFYKSFVLDITLNSVKRMTDESLWIIRVKDLSNIKVIPNLKWVIPMALDTCLKYPVIAQVRYNEMFTGI